MHLQNSSRRLWWWKSYLWNETTYLGCTCNLDLSQEYWDTINLKTRPEGKNPDLDSNLFLDPHACASSHPPFGAQAHNDNNQKWHSWRTYTNSNSLEIFIYPSLYLLPSNGYGLNICLLPNSYAGTLNPNVMVWGGGAFGRWFRWSNEGGAPQ